MRDQLRQTRNAASLAQPNAAMLLLRQFQTIQIPSGAVVSGYMPIGSEINPLRIMDTLASGHVPLCLPVVAEENAPLEFRTYKMGDPLMTRGKFDIPEPLSNQAAAVPNILLVPLLGFNRAGDRIGYGKGYYDYTLAALRAKNPKLLAVGLAYAEQEIHITPAAHDQPLNIVVTPRETLYCFGP